NCDRRSLLQAFTLRICLFGSNCVIVFFRNIVDSGFSALLIRDWRRCIGEWIMAVPGLRERDDFANRVGARQQRQDTVPPEGNATVRWSAVLESIQQEAELLLGVFIGNAHDVENTFLDVLVVDTD